MSFLDFLQGSLQDLHRGYRQALEGITLDRFHHRPGGRANHMAFTYWHYVRTQDNLIRFVLQRRPTLWIEGGWHERFGLDAKHQGTGYTPEQAEAVRIPSLDAWREYMEGVFQETESFLRTVREEDLDRQVTVKPLGELTLRQILGGVILTHGWGHLGEVWCIRGLLGLPGSPI